MGRRSGTSVDTCSPPCIATIRATELEVAAGPRTVLVVAAPEGLCVEPETRGAEGWSATRPTSSIVAEELGQQVGTLPLEPLPRVLTVLVKHTVERRAGDDKAAGTAAVARLNHREPSGGNAHERTFR